jgi:hypothetical protein
MEVAAALHDEELARKMYDSLAPFDGQNVVVGTGLSIRGAVARYLGLGATVLGDDERAERHFDQALALNLQMGAKPRARTQLDYAAMLARRGDKAAVERALQLCRAGSRTAGQLGMAIAAERAGNLAAQLG